MATVDANLLVTHFLVVLLVTVIHSGSLDKCWYSRVNKTNSTPALPKLVSLVKTKQTVFREPWK